MSEQANICVIDDDKEVREITGQLLELGGFRARCYERVQDFLDEFDEASVDCVVTDLRMPEMDGADLQRRLREKGSIVSLMVLTGFADLDIAEQMRNDEAVTLVEKPYDPEKFLTLVGQLVEQTRARRRRSERPLESAHTRD